MLEHDLDERGTSSDGPSGARVCDILAGIAVAIFAVACSSEDLLPLTLLEETKHFNRGSPHRRC